MNKAVTKRVAMHGTGREYLRRLSADIRRDRWLYALLVPGVVYFLVFKLSLIHISEPTRRS